MTSETPAKLPVWKTALECYRLTFRHLGDLLRFSWPWLLLLIALSGALYWGLYPAEQEALAKTGTGSNLLWILTSALISTAIGAFIAVPWHRLLFLGEKQSLAGWHFVYDATAISSLCKAVAAFAADAAPSCAAHFSFFQQDTSDEPLTQLRHCLGAALISWRLISVALR